MDPVIVNDAIEAIRGSNGNAKEVMDGIATIIMAALDIEDEELSVAMEPDPAPWRRAFFYVGVKGETYRVEVTRKQ